MEKKYKKLFIVINNIINKMIGCCYVIYNKLFNNLFIYEHVSETEQSNTTDNEKNANDVSDNLSDTSYDCITEEEEEDK